MPETIKTCCIIGAGNVATHIAVALSHNIDIKQIFSRQISNAISLCHKIKADGHSNVKAIDDLNKLNPGADLYLISVPDDHIAEIINATNGIDHGIWAHTSGSIPMDIFAGKKKRYGVFYPLQTFSKTRKVDMREVPMLIEGCIGDVAESLYRLAQGISDDVKYVDSEGRESLHVAAVFACNFVNYMWSQADSLLHRSGLDISVLRPLLKETLAKLDDLSPKDAQTGPARRGDTATIAKHLARLDSKQAEIYRLLSSNIMMDYD